jgi:hypothetical protein
MATPPPAGTATAPPSRCAAAPAPACSCASRAAVSRCRAWPGGRSSRRASTSTRRAPLSPGARGEKGLPAEPPGGASKVKVKLQMDGFPSEPRPAGTSSQTSCMDERSFIGRARVSLKGVKRSADGRWPTRTHARVRRARARAGRLTCRARALGGGGHASPTITLNLPPRAARR